MGPPLQRVSCSHPPPSYALLEVLAVPAVPAVLEVWDGDLLEERVSGRGSPSARGTPEGGSSAEHAPPTAPLPRQVLNPLFTTAGGGSGWQGRGSASSSRDGSRSLAVGATLRPGVP